MLGLIVGCVAMALVADIISSPETLRAARIRWRARRLARLQRDRSISHANEIAAKAQLPHLRLLLAQEQVDHRDNLKRERFTEANLSAVRIERLLAEIVKLEPCVNPSKRDD